MRRDLRRCGPTREPWKEQFNASGEFSELRMRSEAEVEYTVTIRASGYAPATASATTDTAGRADVEMRLKPAKK